MFNLKFSKQLNFGIFIHLYIVHGSLPIMGYFFTYDFIIPFERARFELSEKPKITVIRHSELELWPFKDASLFFISSADLLWIM